MVKPQFHKSISEKDMIVPWCYTKQVLASLSLFAISFVVFRSAPSLETNIPPPSSLPKTTQRFAANTKTDPPLRQATAQASVTRQQKADAAKTCVWRPEPLQGICDGTKSTPESQVHKSAKACEEACCASDTCITFQYRSKEGCLWGADTRLGAEKDGVHSWCEPRPPDRWQGQRIKNDGAAVPGACNAGWNAQQLSGQCFGLGGKRQTKENTAEACRDACCNSDCTVWQWRKDAGCFYNSKGGYNCQQANPQDLEAFVGKRKVQKDRIYKPYAYSEDFADMAGTEKKNAS